jgi:hypothetical protein
VTYLVGVVGTITKTSFFTQELDIRSTTFKAFLKLDLVLYNERLALGVDGLGEEGRNGVMSSLGF